MKAESGKVEEREEKMSSLSLSCCFPTLFFFSFLPHRAVAERASERRTTLLGRARLFSRFQVPLTLAAPFEDQPEGSAEEKE